MRRGCVLHAENDERTVRQRGDPHCTPEGDEGGEAEVGPLVSQCPDGDVAEAERAQRCERNEDELRPHHRGVGQAVREASDSNGSDADNEQGKDAHANLRS